jgi:hypothetical protein
VSLSSTRLSVASPRASLGIKLEHELIFIPSFSFLPVRRCLFKDVEERSFLEQQDSVANVLRGGAGRKWFIKGEVSLSSLLSSLLFARETLR